MNTGTYAKHDSLLPLFGAPTRNGNITRSVLNVVIIYRPVRSVGLSYPRREARINTGEMKAPATKRKSNPR